MPVSPFRTIKPFWQIQVEFNCMQIWSLSTVKAQMSVQKSRIGKKNQYQNILFFTLYLLTQRAEQFICSLGISQMSFWYFCIVKLIVRDVRDRGTYVTQNHFHCLYWQIEQLEINYLWYYHLYSMKSEWWNCKIWWLLRCKPKNRTGRGTYVTRLLGQSYLNLCW